jgi:menaquinone-dependent protoporphyrinogen oxidase
MRILIAVASRHGGTRGIAEAIGQELRTAGHSVTVEDAGAEGLSVEGYDAALLGSAVYMGVWLPQARQFVERNAAALAAMPVWLFSSGPLGDDPQPGPPLTRLDALLRETGAREHRIFAGSLDKGEIGFGERVIAQVVKAPEGDFRDWPAIRAWADGIAAALAAPVVPVG